MEPQQSVLLMIEEAINGVVGLDPFAREGFAKLHGRRIAVDFKDWGLTLQFVPDANGRLQVLKQEPGNADAVIRATPLDFVETAMADRKEDQVFKGKVVLEGDTKLAQRFSDIFAALDIDWEEQLSKVTGDVIAHELGNALTGFSSWAKRSRRVMTDNLGEYLTEERKLLPTPFEVEEWSEGVEKLRDDVDRLATRIVRLISTTGDKKSS